MNSLKLKDIYKDKDNKIFSNFDKTCIKKIKESTIINSMMIYPKLLKNEIDENNMEKEKKEENEEYNESRIERIRNKRKCSESNGNNVNKCRKCYN